MKLLRRRTFCREEDYIRLIRPRCQEVGYHRFSWQPISIHDLKVERTVRILADKPWTWDEFYSGREKYQYVDYNPLPDEQEDRVVARQYISFLQTSNLLYEKKWVNWAWQFENDRIWLRYFSNRSWKVLGVAVLERDYDLTAGLK